MKPSATALVALATLAACESSLTQPDMFGADGFPSEMLPAAGQAVGEGVVVRNGDMEGDFAWRFYASPGTEATYVEGGGRAGSRGVRLAATANSNAMAYAGQIMRVDDLTWQGLTLTAHLRLEDVRGRGVALVIRGDNTSGGAGSARAFASTQGRVQISGSGDWARYSVRLDGIGADIDQLVVFVVLLGGTTGTVYVDDVTLTSEDAGPPVALMNGGFEQVTTQGPAHWLHGSSSGQGAAGFSFGWSSTGAYEGTRAVSITRGVSPGDAVAFWQQTIRADDFRGGPVTLRARVRTDVTGGGVALAIRGDNTPIPAGSANAFATTEFRQRISGSSEWQEWSVTLNHVPAEIRVLTVFLLFLPGTTGTAYFDAVELTR